MAAWPVHPLWPQTAPRMVVAGAGAIPRGSVVVLPVEGLRTAVIGMIVRGAWCLWYWTLPVFQNVEALSLIWNYFDLAGLMFLMVFVSALPFAFTFWFFVGLLGVIWAKSSPARRVQSPQSRRPRDHRHLPMAAGMMPLEHHGRPHHQPRPSVALMDLHLSLHRRDIGPDGRSHSLVSHHCRVGFVIKGCSCQR